MRYYTSKKFYRFIKPGAVRVDAAASESSGVFPLAFLHAANQETTLVLINDSASPRAIPLAGTGLPANFSQFNTTATDNCTAAGTVSSAARIVLPPNSVVTLYHKD